MAKTGLGKDTKTGGNPSFQLYVLKLLNSILGALTGILNKVPTSSQIFIATPGQDTFTPIVTPTALTTALSGGSIYSPGNGLSIVGITVVFNIPFGGGEVVDIRTP